MMVFGKVRVDLRTRAIHHHQTDAETVKKTYIVDDTRKVFMLNGLAAKHDDKRFAPMGINIGNRMAESLDQFSSTLLHHGKTSQ